jgi:transcriptional regulator with XRE-family HTH domain
MNEFTMETMEALLDRKLAMLSPKRGRNDHTGGNVEVGKVIDTYRKRVGLTKQDLADRTGMHRSFLSRLISGERGMSIETFAKLEGVFAHDSFAFDILRAYRDAMHRDSNRDADDQSPRSPGEQPTEVQPLVETGSQGGDEALGIARARRSRSRRVAATEERYLPG